MTKTKGKPDPIDVHVGSRIRAKRMALGKSQEWLGAVNGVSYQQQQKQEYGTNRVSASALYRISQALDVPISFFFNGLPE